MFLLIWELSKNDIYLLGKDSLSVFLWIFLKIISIIESKKNKFNRNWEISLDRSHRSVKLFSLG